MSDTSSTTYKVNDILIEYGQAFQIDKIEKEKGKKDTTNSIIHYHTLFTNANQQPVYCSIPSSALDDSGTRKPISQKDAKKVLQSLKKSAPTSNEESEIDYDATLQQNDIFQTAAMVKKFYQLKNDPEEKFSATKSNQYEAGLKHMSEELAVVFDSDPKTMRKKILSYLKK